MNRLWLVLAITLSAAACESSTAPDEAIPANLGYRLDASGDPDAPLGILLEWDAVDDSRLTEYRIYSRPSSSASYDLRASTTSTTFHDTGVPDLDYYVTAVLGKRETRASNTIRIDERLRLPAPTAISSISLNGAIHLSWTDNAYVSNPNRFRWYRVYSTSLDLDANLCGTNWTLEGTTVSSAFLASNMTNGIPRCFGVSAESLEGYESLWSPIRGDTPRPDARNVLLFPVSINASKAGFRFFQDANNDGKATPLELGIVADGNRTDIDFQVYVDVSNKVWLKPVRAGVTVAVYGSTPVNDLTDIDVAPPNSAFSTPAVEAVASWGYVFKISGGTFPSFGAVRVTHASKDYVILDWSYQTDAGNPELTPPAR